MLSSLGTRKGELRVNIKSVKNQFGVQRTNAYLVFWQRDHGKLTQ